MSEFITLREAAERLGVHYMTVYRYVRLGLLAAHKDDRTWLIASRDLDMFQHGNASDSSVPVSKRTAPWDERLENRLLAGDQSGAWKVIEAALASGTTPLHVYSDMLVPALRSIGERWESGQIGVDREHQASVMVARIIGRLGPRFSTRGRRKGAVVLAAPPGERHGLGLAMAGDALRGGGYTAVDLGPDTPVEALESAISRTEQLRAVCLGIINPSSLEAARDMVRAARRHLDRASPVILGGGAVASDSQARELGADGKADLLSVVDAVEAGRESQSAVMV
ncbi:MAG: B12-binding domain-containing protein [Acidimicrobiia bacterium]